MIIIIWKTRGKRIYAGRDHSRRTAQVLAAAQYYVWVRVEEHRVYPYTYIKYILFSRDEYYTHTQTLARVYLYGCINIFVNIGIYVYRNRHKHLHIHIGSVIPARGGNSRAAVCIAVSDGRLLVAGGGRAPKRAVSPGHQHDCRPGSRTTSCHGTSNAHKNIK